MLLIRPATLDDLPLMMDLFNQLREDEGVAAEQVADQAELTAQMTQYLQLPSGDCVLFYAPRHDDQTQHEVVGYAMYFVNETDVLLKHFFVARHRRREKMGKQMMQMLVNEIWSPKAGLWLEVFHANPAGLAFWESLGYETVTRSMQLNRTKFTG
jgi:ribosomal protein S18 acetylase RimI-like enzyme